MYLPNCPKIRSVRYMTNLTDYFHAPTRITRCYETYVLFHFFEGGALTIIQWLSFVVLIVVI